MFLQPAFLVLLTLGIGPGAEHPAAAVSPHHAALQVAAPAQLQGVPATPAEPGLPLGSNACDPGAAVSTGDLTTAAACGRCPPEWPRCNRDRDCDSVCGGKGTGVCEWINSCFKCCTCGGTT